MKNALKNRRLIRLVAVLAMIFVGNAFSMRMSPQQSQRARAALTKQTASKQGVQAPVGVQSTKTDAEKIQELKEAFMSDDEVAVSQKTKSLKSGEYFVHAKGTSDGVVVKRDVLEQSPTLKGMLEGITWSQDSASIPLPFSADDIKLVFQVMNKKVNAVKLSLDQLGAVISCYDYLLMDMNSTDLINAVVARINDIGDKIMKREVTPDYTVFGHITDPNVVKIIIDKVLSTPKNFCKKFTDEENYRYGRSDDGNPSDQWNYNPEQDVNQVFRGLTSINAILNKVKDALARWDKISAKYRKEEEDKKKWFWQRW